MVSKNRSEDRDRKGKKDHFINMQVITHIKIKA